MMHLIKLYIVYMGDLQGPEKLTIFVGKQCVGEWQIDVSL
jgi:hypothetical protein